ncbi:MAG: O-antigen ligase family protein [Acidobacteriota bacterium]
MSRQSVPFALLILFAFLTPAISAAYIVFGLLAVAWVIQASREGRLRDSLRSPYVFLAGLFAMFTLLSAAFSRDPSMSSRHLGGLSLLLLLPLTMDTTDTLRRARTLALALSASGGVLAVLGVWQFVHGGNDLENRIRGTLSHYMTFSGLAMIAACLLLGFALEGRGAWRLVGLLGVVPLAAVLLTFTRGAYVGMVAASLLLLGVRRPRGLLWLAPALVLVFFLAPPEIRGRIRSIADLSDRTNRDRIAMVHAGARMVADDPLFGLGPDMVERYYPLYRDADAPRWRVPHLHNNALQIAASSGILAAGAYLALMGLFLARTIVLLKNERQPQRAAIWAGVLLAGTAVMVAGLFEYNFGDTEVEMATLLVLAIPFSRAAAPSALESP